MKTETELAYSTIDKQNPLVLIQTVRDGIEYKLFTNLANKSLFGIKDWSNFLHLSERTIQRYKKEQKKFDPVQSEKILEITLLNKKGAKLFGNNEKFNAWLNTKNIAIGGFKPRSILDSTFGINMLNDELTRIEHGVLA